MKKTICASLLVFASAAFGGQHSGLGGGNPSQPPVTDPTQFPGTLEEFYAWLASIGQNSPSNGEAHSETMQNSQSHSSQQTQSK